MPNICITLDDSEFLSPPSNEDTAATTLDIVSEQTKESRGLEGMSQKRNKAMLRRGAGANGERKEPCSKAEKASGGVREVRDCGDMGCSGEAGV